MTNMSYCRFRNTLRDLTDCRDAIADIEMEEIALKDVSREEREALTQLVGMAWEILNAVDACDADDEVEAIDHAIEWLGEDEEEDEDAS